MKINVNKYFEAAKKENITPFELTYSMEKETTVSTYNDTVEEQTIGSCFIIHGKGIVNGKLGMYGTDKIDNSTPEELTKRIIESAKFGREEKKENFFSGGLKYKKAKIYSKDFVDSDLFEIKELALKLTKETKKRDKRITKVEVYITKEESEYAKYNDLGLIVKEKTRNYSFGVSVICKDKDDTRTGHDYCFSFKSLKDIEEKADKVINNAIKRAADFLFSKPIKSAKYKCVLSPSVTASLIANFLGGLNAKACQKHTSPFENKKGEQICSKLITIKHTPHIETPSATSYDAEGYPTQDFDIIKKGILTNYFHSIETARASNEKPNGCGCSLGEAMFKVITVSPSKKSEEELISKIKKGLYISKVTGLNAGIDDQTLNFSLPCEGYEIIDGKINKSTSMIICAGNLKDLFMDVIAVGNNNTNFEDVIAPSVVVKSINIAGE